MSAWELYQKGGVMMGFITLLSVYVLGVIFYKAWQWVQTKPLRLAVAQAALQDIKAGNFAEAELRLKGDGSPVAVVMAAALHARTHPQWTDAQREAEVMRVGAFELQRMERHLRGLEMAAAVAPLLGLLGTVIGLINSFSKLGAAGTRVDPAMLAGGIWEALLTTAAGLAVAITAFAAHYVFDALVDRLRSAMQDMATQAMNHSPATYGERAPQAEKTAVKLTTPKYVHP